MKYNTFDARSLWASMGVPYLEPDRITAADVAVVREMLYSATLRSHVDLHVDTLIPPYAFLKRAFALAANATVVGP